ncbi:MAG: Bsp6I family type II restriction endonuclease [Candidatus Azambacteria bacterium]|nr:Bsp6I family type II restriction endonuclease [Candidatus Azambacteria bacterium]
MKLEIHKITLKGMPVEIEVAHLDQADGQEFKRLFDLWKKLNKGLEKYGRKVNIPEVISEGMFCVFSKSVRYQRKIKGKVSASFDTINLSHNKREQVKATSVKEDLTSFGPRAEWDDLYFLDFYNHGKLDGTFNVYLIPNKLIYSRKVNKGQTMKDQQKENKRPRFSITKEIIRIKKLKPLAKNVKVW